MKNKIVKIPLMILAGLAGDNRGFVHRYAFMERLAPGVVSFFR